MFRGFRKFTEIFKVFFTEKLRLFTHVVGNLSPKGIARRALPASGGIDAVATFFLL